MSAGPSSAELIRSALISALVQSGWPATPGSKVRAITALIAGTLTVVAVAAAMVCLFVAAWIAVRPLVGPVGTPLVIAAGLLILGLVGLVVLRWARRPRRGSTASPMPLEAILEDAARLVTAHKGPVLMAALLVGLVAAGSSGSRK